jgi:hypothetical protein
MAMFAREDAADLLRAMAHGLEAARCDEGIGPFRRN